jgi:8-oxo-dGTP pyrophosphatase MutT (NUDIX family)
VIERHRRAGRALVRRGDGRVVLFRGVDPQDRARGGFWFTPGGGLDGEESAEEAVRRELREELGLVEMVIGPVVMRRRDRFPMLGEIWHQDETLHLVEVGPGFEPDTAGLEAQEASVITDVGWFAADELARLDEPYYPAGLATLLAHLDRHGPPAVPWVEDLTGRLSDGA